MELRIQSTSASEPQNNVVFTERSIRCHTLFIRQIPRVPRRHPSSSQHDWPFPQVRSKGVPPSLDFNPSKIHSIMFFSTIRRGIRDEGIRTSIVSFGRKTDYTLAAKDLEQQGLIQSLGPTLCGPWGRTIGLGAYSLEACNLSPHRFGISRSSHWTGGLESWVDNRIGVLQSGLWGHTLG